jgi:hypothetical protein
MANRLKMAQQQAVIALAQRGWSYRRIARELGVHRETVARYVRLAAEDAAFSEPGTRVDISKPANLIAGSDDAGTGLDPPKPAIPITCPSGIFRPHCWHRSYGFRALRSSRLR